MKKMCCAGKRLVLFLAVMILILSGIVGAQAKTTLRVIGEFYDWPKDMQWYKDWVKLHPRDELKVNTSIYPTYQNAEELIKALEAKKGKYSVMRIESAYADWEQVRDSGLLVDLSGSEQLTSYVGRMYPVFQEMVYKDGKLTGIPCASCVDWAGLCCNPECWEKAGYGAEDVPTCFLDLLDFLEKWAERNEAEPTGISLMQTYMFVNFARDSYTDWLSRFYVDQYVNQCLMQGERPVFNTPEAITILKKIAWIGEALYECDSKVPRTEIQWDTEGEYGFHTSWLLEDGMYGSYIIPCRVTKDAPEIYPVHMEILCIPQNAPEREQALEFVEHYIQHVNDAVPSDDMSYETRDYLEWKSQLLTDAEATDSYREMVSHMEYSHWNYEIPFAQKIQKAISKFAAGSISAEELVVIIDESITADLGK